MGSSSSKAVKLTDKNMPRMSQVSIWLVFFNELSIRILCRGPLIKLQVEEPCIFHSYSIQARTIQAQRFRPHDSGRTRFRPNTIQAENFGYDSGRTRFRPITIQAQYARFRSKRHDSGPSRFRPGTIQAEHDSGRAQFRPIL